MTDEEKMVKDFLDNIKPPEPLHLYNGNNFFLNLLFGKNYFLKKEIKTQGENKWTQNK